MLDGLLTTLRMGSTTPEIVYTMMEDAQAQAFEHNMTRVGQFLAYWR